MKREGPGWRLAFDRYREGHQALIGGDGWALELSDFELQLLRELCLRLLEQHQAIADQLMAEEEIEITLEQDCWWLELCGDREQWDLRFVLTGLRIRGAEGSWKKPASSAFVLALAQLDCF